MKMTKKASRKVNIKCAGKKDPRGALSKELAVLRSIFDQTIERCAVRMKSDIEEIRSCVRRSDRFERRRSYITNAYAASAIRKIRRLKVKPKKAGPKIFSA